jgi:hypothetical protein
MDPAVSDIIVDSFFDCAHSADSLLALAKENLEYDSLKTMAAKLKSVCDRLKDAGCRLFDAEFDELRPENIRIQCR